MRLSFDSIEEVKEFVANLKGTRGGKNKEEDAPPASAQPPAPMQPPTGAPAAFNPTAAPSAFPGAPTPPAGPPPEIAALVKRIVDRIDGAIAGGQPPDSVLGWFRANVGDPGAASATMDQIKTHFLPKAPQPVLENIAKLMAA